MVDATERRARRIVPLVDHFAAVADFFGIIIAELTKNYIVHICKLEEPLFKFIVNIRGRHQLRSMHFKQTDHDFRIGSWLNKLSISMTNSSNWCNRHKKIYSFTTPFSLQA